MGFESQGVTLNQAGVKIMEQTHLRQTDPEPKKHATALYTCRITYIKKSSKIYEI